MMRNWPTFLLGALVALLVGTQGALAEQISAVPLNANDLTLFQFMDDESLHAIRGGGLADNIGIVVATLTLVTLGVILVII